MKILYLPFALLCGLSNITDVYASEPEASCQDDHKYTYLDNDEVALTCGEIREFDETRQELCLIEEVKIHCPFSCGICCEDNESYIINCDWIVEQGWRKVEYCGQTFEHRMVQEMCPIACDYCMDHVDGTETSGPTSHPVERPITPAPHVSTKAPSRAPSGHVVPSSSKAPTSYEAPSSKVPTPVTQPVSNDAVDVTFQYVIADMCAWVSASTERIESFCGQSQDANAEVFAKCPATCSQLESRSNAYPCSDLPDTYTFPALYTDALRTCSWVGMSQKRKDRYCKPEQQLTACAITCGVCDLAATSRPSSSISPSNSSAPSYRPSRPPSPQPSPFQTLRPTAAPSISINPSSSIKPSSVPTRGDTPGYLFNRTPDQEEANMVPCEWLCSNSVSPVATYERQETWCHGDILENCHASCHSPPGCVTTTLTTLRFGGLKEAVSIERGIIDLEWHKASLSEDSLFDMNEIVYHIFISVGEFNFTKALNTTDVLSLANYFQNEEGFQYNTTTALHASISSLHYGLKHTALVVAEAQDIFSTNSGAFSVVLSSRSPVIDPNATIKGFFMSTNALDITIEGPDLIFTGALLDNHIDIQVGEFLTGMASDGEVFVIEVMQIITIESDKVHVSVQPTDPIQDLIKELHYSSEFSLPGDDENSNNGAQQSRRDLLISKAILSRKSSGEPIFIGDAFTGIVNDSIVLSPDTNFARSLESFTSSYTSDKSWMVGRFPESGPTYAKMSSINRYKVTIEKSEEDQYEFVEAALITSTTFRIYVDETGVDVTIASPQIVVEGPKFWKIILVGKLPIYIKAQPFLKGYIRIRANLKVRGHIGVRVIGSPYIKLFSTRAKDFDKGFETLEPEVKLCDNGVEVDGEIHIHSELSLEVEVSVFWNAFKATLKALLVTNLFIAASLFNFPSEPSPVIALEQFFIGNNLWLTLDLESDWLPIAPLPINLGMIPLPIFIPIPQASWLSPEDQICEVENKSKIAKIKNVGIEQHPDFVGHPSYYATEDLSEWSIIGVPDYTIELHNQLPVYAHEAPATSGKIYAFIHLAKWDCFFPIVYETDLDKSSASCPFIPTPSPTKTPTFPTASPTACDDTNGFTWNRIVDGETVITKCDWLCQNKNMVNTNNRQLEWCNDENAQNTLIKKECCYSCTAPAGCNG